MGIEPVAGSLAQLLKQRSRAAQAMRRPEPPMDAGGQFGFSFDADPAVPSGPAPPDSSVGQVSASRPATLPSRQRDGAPWTVGALVSTLRGQLESHGVLWVVGEISNLRPAQSGHLYFTLKDGEAQLGVVLFRRQAALLQWQPADGTAVLVRGRISIFEGRGQLQLIAESLEPRGAGALQLQFERLKAKLRDEGLFESERKRALPAFPRRVGVVTSLQGAVIRDVVTVCRRRHGCMNLLVYPAAVQGSGAAAEITAGILYLNEAAQRGGAQVVDLILIARGGGSAEDLYAFNDEALARAIADSTLPIVSAIGHETDFTIADFVADLRAPTPSAAAEMITETQHRVEERLQSLHARLYRGIRFQQMLARQQFTRLSTDGILRRTQDGIDRRQQRVDSLSERLGHASVSVRRSARERLQGIDIRLQRLDPRQRLRHARVLLQTCHGRLLRTSATLTKHWRYRLEHAQARLATLSPLAVLDRGYSLAFTAEGRLVRSAAHLALGETLSTRFAEGSATAQITEIVTEKKA